jgi:hypothetical protein
MVIDEIMVVQKQYMQKHVRIPENTCSDTCSDLWFVIFIAVKFWLLNLVKTTAVLYKY